MKSQTPRDVKYWRDPRVINADISDMNLNISGPTQTVSRCEAIEDILTERNLPASIETVAAIDEIFRQRASEIAGDALRELLLTLPSTPSVVALRLLISGQASNYREAAKEAKCSHVAIWKQLRAMGYKPS